MSEPRLAQAARRERAGANDGEGSGNNRPYGARCVIGASGEAAWGGTLRQGAGLGGPGILRSYSGPFRARHSYAASRARTSSHARHGYHGHARARHADQRHPRQPRAGVGPLDLDSSHVPHDSLSALDGAHRASRSRARRGSETASRGPFQKSLAMPSPGRVTEGGVFLSRASVAHTRRATARSYWARSRSPFASALSAWRSAKPALTARTWLARPRAACARSRAACARSPGPESHPIRPPTSGRSGRLSRVTARDRLLPTGGPSPPLFRTRDGLPIQGGTSETAS
jgi:hypothetical protein